MRLSLLEEHLSVCQLDAAAPLPDCMSEPGFWSITRTRDELSLVCLEGLAPAEARCEQGWRCLKVEGPLDFSLVGILAELARVLAEAEVSIFALSTFDTDYLLIKSEKLTSALSALRSAGHTLSEPAARDGA